MRLIFQIRTGCEDDGRRGGLLGPAIAIADFRSGRTRKRRGRPHCIGGISVWNCISELDDGLLQDVRADDLRVDPNSHLAGIERGTSPARTGLSGAYLITFFKRADSLIGLTYLLGTRAYLGLGVWSPDPADPTILGFFRPDHVDYWSWLWKALFTIITLSAGFKGGEVTPLFFIGAGLGSALGGLLGAPVDLMAGLGFVAVFAGATNTPLACMVMGIELFGATHGVYIATACFLAYLFSGHSSIYLSQRIGVVKSAGSDLPTGVPVRAIRTKGGRTPAPVATHANSLSIHSNLTERPIVMTHTVSSREFGMVRIYLRPGEKVKGAKRWFGSKPL
ncbi:hypothetical protein G6L84_23840 [Agrobacterium tumefaciens]|nr:hypothetical protein [Agrobacterium tumefaciens]